MNLNAPLRAGVAALRITLFVQTALSLFLLLPFELRDFHLWVNGNSLAEESVSINKRYRPKTRSIYPFFTKAMLITDRPRFSNRP